MADTDTGTVDTEAALAHSSDVDSGTPAGADTDQESKMWADKYDSPEKLEESYLHLRQEATKAEQRAAELAAENEKIRNEQLAKLTEAVAQSNAPHQPTAEENQARVSALADEYGVSEAAVERLGYAEHLAQKAQREAEAVSKAMTERMDAMNAQFAEFSETQDPRYQGNKELVDAMVGKGVSRSAALGLLDILPLAKRTEVPDGAPSTGGLGSAGSAPQAPEVKEANPETVTYLMQNLGLSKEEAIKQATTGPRGRGVKEFI